MTHPTASHAHPHPALRFAGIRCTECRLAEFDNGHVRRTISRCQIRRLTLVRGSQVQRPRCQECAALLLTLLGTVPLPHLFHWLAHGGPLFTRLLYLLPLLVIGPWLLIEAIHKGYFLRVDLDNGAKKLILHGDCNPREMEAFLASAEQQFGYHIERDSSACDPTPTAAATR